MYHIISCTWKTDQRTYYSLMPDRAIISPSEPGSNFGTRFVSYRVAENVQAHSAIGRGWNDMFQFYTVLHWFQSR